MSKIEENQEQKIEAELISTDEVNQFYGVKRGRRAKNPYVLKIDSVVDTLIKENKVLKFEFATKDMAKIVYTRIKSYVHVHYSNLKISQRNNVLLILPIQPIVDKDMMKKENELMRERQQLEQKLKDIDTEMKQYKVE